MIKTLLACVMMFLGLSCGVWAEEAAKDDAAKIAELVAKYPLKTCVVTGAQLGSMGDPVDFLHEGRLVRFCCKGCIKKFNAEPEKFLKQIDEAAAKGGAATAGEVVKADGAKAGGCGGCGGAKKVGCGGCGGAEKESPAAGDAAPKASGAKQGGGCCGRGSR